MYKYIIGGISAAIVVAYIVKRALSDGCGNCKKKKKSGERLDALVMSGPSGVGKGTLINMILKEHPDKFGFSVSHTTRKPREGEQNGREYHFTTREAMQGMIDRGEFLESCDVHGNIYGTSKRALADVKATGKLCIIEMDVQGAQKLRKQQGDLNFCYMFVKAPTVDELEKRIIGRGDEKDEKIKVRLETARSELEWVSKNEDFFDEIIVNDNLDDAFVRFKKVLKNNGGM